MIATLALGAATPVLVELFTSQGCSSCPPADALLAKLDREQPIPGAEVVILSEHVDYWNQLGWRDPFSSPQFGDRQREYTRELRREGVYTPQAVVDGRMHVVGSDEAALSALIASSARQGKARARLAVVGEGVRIDIGPLRLPAGVSAEVWLAIAEDGLSSRVARGENEGRTLWHRAVVRRLTRVGGAGAQGASLHVPLALDPKWQRDKLRVVVFAQRRSGEVLAVGTLRVP